MLSRVVLVEDNPGDVYLIREAIRLKGISCNIVCFDDAEKAADGLRDDSMPVPDAILLDLNLPRGDGLTILRSIKTSVRLRQVPVGILTSSRSPLDRQDAATLNADSYIHKPTDLDDFLEKVGNAIDSLLSRSRNAAAETI